jgi:ABC-2 type transport system permease protein
MTYAFDALNRVATLGSLRGAGARDLALTAGATLLALAPGALTLRRRTA